MSYEIGIEVDLGAVEFYWLLDEWWRYTGKCSFLANAAGLDLATLDGTLAEECILPLASTLDTLRSNSDQFRAHSGTGLYLSLVLRLDTLIIWLAKHPKATMKVAVWPTKSKSKPRRRSKYASTASKRPSSS